MSTETGAKRVETFADLVTVATKSADAPAGNRPYEYQQRIADDGLPDILNVPTGAGKTIACVLPWVWRRVFHREATVRSSTPRRLILVLPTRALTQQTEESVRAWLKNLGLSQRVGVHVTMGGRSDARQYDWRMDMAQEMVVICTADMLVSRALNRGYGVPRTSYSIDFAIVTNGSHIVVDEVQLIPQATATLRQISALQKQYGTAEPSGLTVMSATIDDRVLHTVDNPLVAETRIVTLRESDRRSHLARRLKATRTIRKLDGVGTAASLAQAVLERHRAGTLTLMIVNTVDRAVETYDALKKADAETPLLLIHSRFRGIERTAQMARLTATCKSGGIVVTTQAIEAGVDISSRTLITEAAPWPSVQQRIGRNNRAGEFSDGEATVWWYEAAKSAPYEAADVAATAEALTGLEGQAVTTSQLDEIGRNAEVIPPSDLVLRILRRRDFDQMFDTTPDLSGSDIDVRPFIRADLDIDVQLAWIPDTSAESLGARTKLPPEALRCGAPIPAVSDFVKLPHVKAWVFAPNRDGWIPASSKRLKPQDVVLIAASSGGYDPEKGFTAKSKKSVDVPEIETLDTPECETERIDAGAMDNGPDPRWVRLDDHLVQTRDQARALIEVMDPQGIDSERRRVTAAAALTHDIGKAHGDWQAALLDCVDEAGRPSEDGPWAKSPHRSRLVVIRGVSGETDLLQGAGAAKQEDSGPDERSEEESATQIPEGEDPDAATDEAAIAPARQTREQRKALERAGFRHELVSMFMVASKHATSTLQRLDVEGESATVLLKYLVASHHGHVRVSGRDWRAGRDAVGLFGCDDGEDTPRLNIAGLEFPAARVDLGVFATDRPDAWTDGVMRLLDEVGPFRLAYLEAIVRMADWRASAHLDLPERPRFRSEES